MAGGPDLAMTPEIAAICGELVRREPIFHHRELGTDRADLERMAAPEFHEIGASGRRYSRAFVLATLEERYARNDPDPWETSDFHCQELAHDLYLLTYALVQESRRTRRSTIWRRDPQGWMIVFHQGTVIAP